MKLCNVLAHIFICMAVLFFSVQMSAYATEQTGPAENLYNTYKKHVYQIRVLDKNSGHKKSIGSGFLIRGYGVFATNYHVVAEAIQEPNRHEIEYFHEDGETHPMRIVNFDVIHDLAILSVLGTDNKPAKNPALSEGFLLGSSEMNKGERLYSMGNPHDLGMTIIEGNYNGLLERSMYHKILFSGALNGGMSGGPGMDKDGRIIGVNVATGGDDISYMVPVEYLRALLSETPTFVQSSRPVITAQLKKNAKDTIDQILDHDWGYREFGTLGVPKNTSSIFSCWGDGHEEDEKYHHSHTQLHCETDDDVYITDRFQTGTIGYHIEKFETTTLGKEAFGAYATGRYGSMSLSANGRREEDVWPFNCHSDFIEIADASWKAVICARKYKKYEGLYDYFVSASHLGLVKKNYVTEIWMEGFPKEDAHRFVERFFKGIKRNEK